MNAVARGEQMPKTIKGDDPGRVFRTFRATVLKNGLIVPGDRVLLALSGGADIFGYEAQLGIRYGM